MFIESEKMPGDSRIWIYQSNREFTVEEEQKIIVLGREFVETWTAHNQELKASIDIRNHLFLIIMIDQNYNLASGCSIDKSIHFILKLENIFSISLLDRQVFALKENNRINLIRRREFEHMMETGIINDDTIVYNNLIETKNELKNKWEIPLRESWHAAIRSKQR